MRSKQQIAARQAVRDQIETHLNHAPAGTTPERSMILVNAVEEGAKDVPDDAWDGWDSFEDDVEAQYEDLTSDYDNLT